MGHQYDLQFHGDAPCFHQGNVRRTEVAALFSYGHSNPYMDTVQHPQLAFLIGQNIDMTKPVKQIMAERMEYLMRVNPSLDTLKKISAKADVGYGTVRRVRNADEVDVSISNVEKIAECFGLSLIEFISEPGQAGGLDVAESVLIQKFRSLNQKDQTEVMFFAASKAAINEVMKDQPNLI